MSNKNATNQKDQNQSVLENSNPFDFLSAGQTESKTNRIAYTPALKAQSEARTTELIHAVAKDQAKLDLFKECIETGKAVKMIDLIKSVFDEETIHTDSLILSGATEKEFDSLLESRRSERSKARANKIVSMDQAHKFFSAMYAEILVREAWNKPYEAAGTELDQSDLDAVNRKIKSLQSKKSRLNKLASYDAQAKKELMEVEAEIERLGSLRPNSNVSSKTTIKSADVDTVRAALKQLDMSALSEDEQAKVLALMAKLG